MIADKFGEVLPIEATALCNFNRIVFEEMSSETALTWHGDRDEDSILDEIYF